MNIESKTNIQISAFEESLLVLTEATKTFKWQKEHWSFRGPSAILSGRFACGKSALTQQTSFFWELLQGCQAQEALLWCGSLPSLPTPYSCVLNPIWGALKSTVAHNFRQRKPSMEKKDAVFLTSERCCTFVANQPSSGHRTNSVHHICTVQCSLYILLIETGFTGPRGLSGFPH